MIRPGRALALSLLTLLLAACMGRDDVVFKAALTSITPTSGVVADGTRVTLRGSNFHRLAGSSSGQLGNLSVQVCGVPLEQLELVVESHRTVMLPPASNVRVQVGNELSGVIGVGAVGGTSDVIVILPDGQVLMLPAAFDCQVPGVRASISTDVASGPAPLTVTFEGDGSTSATGEIIEYEWNFGGGVTATGESVNHTFTTVGTHRVALVVIDDTGATDEATVQIEVVNSAPVAAIAVEPASGTANAPVTVTFDAGSSFDADGDAITYSWTIDGAPAGTETTASHTFSRSGIYEVSLSVTDSRGATSGSRLDYVVGNSAPVAVFSTTPDPASGSGPLLVTFDASESSDPDGIITGFEWDLGDGATGTGETISHSFMSGTYTVTLTVEDDEGQKSSVTGQVLVDNTAPVAQFTASLDPATGPAPLTVQFDASESLDPDGSIVSYEWEFGTTGTGKGVSPEHTFLRSGDHTVRLTVTDNEGATATADLLVLVSNASPVAAASVTAVDSYEVSFSAAESYDPDGVIVDYAWNLDDGSILSGETVTHTYVRSGDYNVTLTVTDDEGAYSDALLLVQLSNTLPVAVPEIVSTVGYEVTFSASGSYDPDGGPLTYSWDPGDGSGPVVAETFTHTYNHSGNYTVTLIVTDSESGTHETQVVASPVNIAPTAVAFTDPSPASGFAPLAVDLRAIGSYDQPGGEIVSYEWELAGDVISDSAVYNHVFTAEGLHDVTLTVTDNEGTSDSVSVAVEVLASEVHSVLINEDDQALMGGEVASLTATVAGAGNFNQAVTWQSSDPGVASVSVAGVVTAIADGTAAITATSVQDPSVSDSVQVSVWVPLGTALSERILDMAVDEDDNIYLTGYLTNVDSASTDILLMKLNPQGRLLWRETYGTEVSDLAGSIALDPFDNSIILAGQTHGNLETGAPGESYDLYVMKINANDQSVVWTYQYGGPGWDVANDVIVDGNGDIYFTGAFNRDADRNCTATCGRIIVGRVDSTGTSAEVSLHGHNANGTGEVITLDNDGNILVAGNSLGVFGDPAHGGAGAYLMEVNPANLDERTELVFIDTNRVDYAEDLKVAQDGSIIWVGRDNTVNMSYASTVVRVFNADYIERIERWFQPTGAFHSPKGSFLDRDGFLVIGAGLDGLAIELSRLNLSDLTTVASVQVAVPASPEPPYSQLWLEGIGEQADGTIVAAGYTNTDYFEPNQGGFDPFVWITDPW